MSLALSSDNYRPRISITATLVLAMLVACSESPSDTNGGVNEVSSGGSASERAGGAAGVGGASQAGGAAASSGGVSVFVGGAFSGGDESSGGGEAQGSGGANVAKGSGGEESSSGGAFATGGTDTSPRPDVVAASGTDLIRVDVTDLHQSFEGWGTSLCWWANHVGGWDEAARNRVIDAVVDPVKGLGYNIFRYNIGGGENPSHDHMGEHREMEGFQDADGSWQWDNDPRQRAMLLGINERGSNLILEAFSNSPPYWMTESGCASGSNNGSANLKDDYYDDFAHYLTEVVAHYRDEYGITFRTLEPLNEPNANWWKSDGSQEGCHFSPSDQERILQAVAAELSDKGLTGTLISASDENSMDDALRNIDGYSSETLAVVSQLNVHSYAGSKRRELRRLANDLGKRLWQSESGPLSQNISDETEAALFMAGRIITDLRELEAEAWIDWQSGDPARSWASFTLDNSKQTHTPIKRFFMHAGFSRYIRPGATFVEIDSSDMVAAMSPDGQSLTIVVRNGDTRASRSFTFDVTSLPSVGLEVEAHRTSADEDLVALSSIAVEGYSFVAEIPPYSVTTFIVNLH